MPINGRKNPERVAECQRLITELEDFQDELSDWEKTFMTDLEANISKWGEGTYITDNQYNKLTEIYQRIC